MLQHVLSVRCLNPVYCVPIAYQFPASGAPMTSANKTVHLTDTYVRALKCPDGKPMKEVRDADVSGLEIRVMRSGTKTWRLHYTRRGDGKRRALSIGGYPDMSLKDARTKAKRLQSEIQDGEIRADPASAVQARKEADTFREVAAEWLGRHAVPNKTPRVVADDRSMLERHVLPEIGDMRAGEVTKRDVRRLLDTMQAKADARGKEGSDRKLTHRPNRVHSLIRAIYRWAIGRDMLTIDPTLGLSAPIPKEKERERTLSPAEIKALWAALDRAPIEQPQRKGVPRGQPVIPDGAMPLTRDVALALKLALATGQRIGEVAGIAVAELDLNDVAPVWTVPKERAKNDQASRVPLNPLAVRIVREALALAGEGSTHLFPNADGTEGLSSQGTAKAFERARKALGVAHFRIHDLRRTTATGLAELGFRQETISLILNHISARKGTVTGAVYIQYGYDREKARSPGRLGCPA